MRQGKEVQTVIKHIGECGELVVTKYDDKLDIESENNLVTFTDEYGDAVIVFNIDHFHSVEYGDWT